MTVLKCAAKQPGPDRQGLLGQFAATLALASCLVAPALDAAEPARSMTAASDPVTAAELLDEIRRLRREVGETKQLREEVRHLREEVDTLRAAQSPPAPAVDTPPAKAPPAAAAQPPVPTPSKVASAPPKSQTTASRGIPTRYHSGAFGPPKPAKPTDDNFPITRARYGYNHNATGPLGGGGYFSFSTADDEYSINLTNQLTVDGTFFSQNGLPTDEQGFNIPFTRTYLYGNITKDLSYQIGTQGFLGTFNLLDAWMAWHIMDNLTLRAGKGLAPPLYEYYAFSPALEPVITNSPLFQLAAKRPIGLMFSGTLLENRMQWWSGVNNSGASLFGNLDNNVDYNGALDFTPFRGDAWRQSLWEGLGGGVGFSAGQQHYLLSQSDIAFLNNGEATTNPSFVTVVGLPFYVYNPDISADGMRYRVAPHLYWFGQFSLLAEYMYHNRILSDGTNSGSSTQHAYYVNTSYWLTGERDFVGNGFQAYSTIEPLRPFSPSRGLFGSGAWQIASQWSQFFAGTADMRRGFVDLSRSTSQMDNLMVGVNWWPNKYVRCSFDYVWTWFNNPIPLQVNDLSSGYQTAWMRFAMFF